MKNLLTIIASLLFLAGCCGRGPDVEEISLNNAQAIADAPAVAVAEGDWPWWRGPTRNNIATGEAPPITFSDAENVLWKIDVPGRGHATPVICGERILLATADEATQTQSLVCLHRADGATLWNTEIHRGTLPNMHRKNSHASPTPACDGERVFTAFAVNDAVWLSAVALDGTIIWQQEVGPFSSRHGYGALPVIYKSAVIVAADHQGEGYIAALDRASGDILWRKPRLRVASYATPVVAHVAGRDQLLLSGQNRVVSYDPATGEEIWWCSGSADATANTMAFNDTHVFASGGYQQTGILCIRADGHGDVTNTHIDWEISGMKVYVTSPLVAGDVLVAARDDGIVIGADVASGEVYWKKRLKRGVEISASPTMIGDVVYLPNEAGEVFVFRPAKEFEHLATNEMHEPIFASPVIAEGKIYLRTLSKLYCIGP